MGKIISTVVGYFSPYLNIILAVLCVLLTVLFIHRGNRIDQLQNEVIGYKTNSSSLVIDQVNHANAIATDFETKKADHKSNYEATANQAKAVTASPIYSSTCFDQAGLDILNDYIKSTQAVSK